MKVQTLIATMKRDDFSFLDSMKLEGDVIVINQCDKYAVDYYEGENFRSMILSTTKRGLSNSRNEAVLNSNCDFFLTGDDDIAYAKGYVKLIEEKFNLHPDADIIAFNLEWLNVPDNMIIRKPHTEEKRAPKNRYYPSVSLVYRKKSFERANLHFHPCFGSGSVFSLGEESLILRQARQAGLKIYECPEILAYVDCSESTWFTGYDEKFFFNKGAWLACAYPRIYSIIKYYYLLKITKSELGPVEIIKAINRGVRYYYNEKFL